MSAIPIIAAGICLFGAFPNEGCLSVFQITTVVECATSGDPSTPLGYNQGIVNNPGNGVAVLYDGQEPILSLRFVGRGAFRDGANDFAVYTTDEDLILSDGNEPCACHSRDVDPEGACLALNPSGSQ